MKNSNEKLVFLFLAAASRIERRLDRSLSAIKGISFTEFQLLNQLRLEHNGAATRVDLAASVHLTPSAVTRALQPLEKLGMVRSEKSARDARQTIATLTDAGEEVLDDANQLVKDEIALLSIPKEVSGKLIKFIEGLNFKPTRH